MSWILPDAAPAKPVAASSVSEVRKAEQKVAREKAEAERRERKAQKARERRAQTELEQQARAEQRLRDRAARQAEADRRCLEREAKRRARRKPWTPEVRKARELPPLPMTPDRALTAQLAAVRIAAGLTQRQLAERMNICPSNVTQFERNVRGASPRTCTLREYAEALGCELVIRFVPRGS